MEMEASEFVDVLHYFFEEDTLRYTTGEQAEAASKFRSKLYQDLYHKEYKYALAPTSGASGGRKYVSGDAGFDFDDSIPGTSSRAVKPYIPPTQFNPDSIDPFGGVLDSPIG